MSGKRTRTDKDAEEMIINSVAKRQVNQVSDASSYKLLVYYLYI